MAHRLLPPCCALATCAFLLLGACKTSSSTSPAPEAPESDVSIVEAAVVVAECPDSRTMNARAAREAIRKLVDPCAAVPGGSAHFAATLMPDGRIALAAPSGDPAEGVVPTCVLQNKLVHRVPLKQACKFDVQLVERPAPAGSASAP